MQAGKIIDELDRLDRIGGQASRQQFHHVNNIAPTIFEVFEITPPKVAVRPILIGVPSDSTERLKKIKIELK